MVKDHTDSERGNPLPPHGLLFSISSKGSHRHDNTYHGLCYTRRERERDGDRDRETQKDRERERKRERERIYKRKETRECVNR